MTIYHYIHTNFLIGTIGCSFYMRNFITHVKKIEDCMGHKQMWELNFHGKVNVETIFKGNQDFTTPSYYMLYFKNKFLETFNLKVFQRTCQFNTDFL